MPKLIDRELVELAAKYGNQKFTRDPVVFARYISDMSPAQWLVTEFDAETGYAGRASAVTSSTVTACPKARATAKRMHGLSGMTCSSLVASRNCSPNGNAPPKCPSRS